MPDMEILKQRNNVYGNCFPAIASYWSDCIGVPLKPSDVAELMAYVKRARMEVLAKKGLVGSPEYIDSQKDCDNYCWIADHYDEYCKQFGE